MTKRAKTMAKINLNQILNQSHNLNQNLKQKSQPTLDSKTNQIPIPIPILKLE